MLRIAAFDQLHCFVSCYHSNNPAMLCGFSEHILMARMEVIKSPKDHDFHESPNNRTHYKSGDSPAIMRALVHLLGFLIPLLALFFSFEHVLYDTSFYQDEFISYDAYAAVPDADRYVQELLEFYRSGKQHSLPLSLDEMEHIKDVKEVLDRVHIAFQSLALLGLLVAVAILL